MFGTIREARLRGQAADRYPFLPVRMWTQAARMVEVVQEHLARIGRELRSRRRPLPDEDFLFRGGFRHEPASHTRMTDSGLPQGWTAPTEDEAPPPKIL